MTVLAAAAISALWSLYDATGIRPEYVIPVLALESNFDPTVGNRAGTPYYGIGQNGGAWLAARGIDPQDFLTWTAEQQITAAVTPYFLELVRQYGPIRSATRAYQGNFLPATLPTARSLAQIVTVRGTQAYTFNAGLDPLKHGAITVSDLALVMARQLARLEVQQAIRDAYAQRPAERPRNPVYGDDFLDPRAWLLVPAAGAAYALRP